MTTMETMQHANAVLGLAATTLDGIEALRIATAARVNALTREGADADGEHRGLGLSPANRDVAQALAVLEQMEQQEHQQTLYLSRLMRQHPLGPFVKQARGVGEKQAARLLAATGDPYIASKVTKTDSGKILSVDVGPRSEREFLAYCGYAIAPGSTTAVRRQKGQKANWSADAKMRAYLIANSIIKAGGPYRLVYDEARARHDDSLHRAECVRCGPSGKPAQVGSMISAGHSHARALRAVSKRVLSDLYYAAKAYHEAP